MQEDVDVVGLSILSGAHMTLFPRVLDLLHEAGPRHDILITGGGILPREDIEELQRRGIGKLFGPAHPPPPSSTTSPSGSHSASARKRDVALADAFAAPSRQQACRQRAPLVLLAHDHLLVGRHVEIDASRRR